MKKSEKTSAEKIVARFQLEAMANLRSKVTGVEGAVIWVSAGEFYGVESQHGPRIKVVPGNKLTSETLKDAVSVTLSDPPQFIGELPGKIKKQVVKFISKNREVLLQYWKGEIGIDEVLEALESL